MVKRLTRHLGGNPQVTGSHDSPSKAPRLLSTQGGPKNPKKPTESPVLNLCYSLPQNCQVPEEGRRDPGLRHRRIFHLHPTLPHRSAVVHFKFN